MTRATSQTMVPGSQLYSYLEVTNWTVGASACTFNAAGGITSSYSWSISNVTSYIKWWENGVGHDLASGTDSYSGYTDKQLAYVSEGFTRQASDRNVTLECYTTCSLGSGSATLSYTVPHLASAPSGLTATRNSDTSITLNWTNPSTSYDSVYIQYSRNGGSWTALTNKTTSTSHTWTSAVADSVYRFRVYTTYQGSTSGYSNTATAYTTPTAPSSLTATRNSDTKVTLSWTNNSSSYTGTYIERQTDGGSWSSLANVAKGTTSYADTTTSADHAYKYRVRAYNGGIYSSYATSSAVTMSPSRPTAMSTSAIQGSTNVSVTLSNASKVATSIEWQTSTDGSTWSASTTVSGSPVTSFTVTGLSGTGYIRVRNKNATGTSAWLVSDAVTTICPPSPPTLLSPSGNVVDMSDGDIAFSWRHNALDGSSQTAYELQYAVNGGAASTLSGSTSQETTLSLSGLSVGDSVSWKVRTKGADPSYSDWSATKTFSLYTAPSLSITSPASTVSGMPISISVTYSDMAGFDCVSASYSLMQDGAVMFTEPLVINGSSLTASLDVSEFLPENGGSYEVSVEARSSSSLTATATASFDAAFQEPVAGELSVENDPETGYVTLAASFPNAGAGEIAADSVSVSRVNPDGTVTPLIERGGNGSGFMDIYAPLNTPYQYAVTTHAASEAVRTVYVDNAIETDFWFAYWRGNVAKAVWNPQGGIDISRPHKTRVWYAGRKDPVSYDGSAVSLSEKPSWVVVGMDEIKPFVKLMEDGGRGVYKSCDGWVYHADFELDLKPEYTAIGYYGGVSLSVTRIAGDRL